ncbi:MAG: elongation factor G [Saccharofermentans sp.]|jgi:elongation factor G|nr:elongation factor G [Mageeibacillus sp.]MCI1264332.1 elongation factor G [Saccharofermentans sp.]MCI1275588.1 elongation factor G [Saccharofermentans sp.]
MEIYSADKIRNIALFGHVGSGKTTLAEAILFYTKAISRQGRVEGGSTTLDYDSEEIKRGMSVSLSVACCEYKGSKINIIDTPGDFDFLGEEMSGIRVADSGVIMISAKGGTSVGSQKAIRLLDGKNVPYLFFVNRMDEPNSDYEGVVSRMTERYGDSVIPLSFPIMEDGEMTGIVDVMNRKAFSINKKTGAFEEFALPEEYQGRVSELQDRVNQVVAAADDTLMEKYFAGEEFTEDEFRHGVHVGFREGKLHPIYCGSAYMNWGIDFLLNCIAKDTPPAGKKPALTATLPSGGTVDVSCNVQDPMAAFIFKTISDPFVGKISIFKVNSGTIRANSTCYNATKGRDERIGGLFYLRGKEQIATDKVTAGDIGAASKLTSADTNDTLCDRSRILEMPKIKFPSTCLSKNIVPLKKGDEDKIISGLAKLSDGDRCFTVETNPETKQMVLSGIGDMQLKVLVSQLQERYKVDCELRQLKVPYRETIRKKVKVQGKHKKQSGGHGQYGDVWIEFEPNPDTEALVFEENVFGGAVPKNFFPAVEKGLEESVQCGILAGYPVVNLKATLVDGSYHEVDSSEMAFKIAANLAFKAGMAAADPIILEPISKAEIHIPEDKQGDIMGDLNKRRARIVGIDADDDGSVIHCAVPTAEMLDYATDLKSMTQGRGWFVLSHVRYDPAPQDIADKVIAAAQANA